MKQQLRLLLELQRIDSRVHELLSEIENIPKRLAPAQKDLAMLEALFAQEKQRVAETEAWHKDQERIIQLDDDAVKKAKIKLQAAKNSKDYSAGTRELDNKRKSKSEREDEVLKVMDALEKSRSQVTAHEKEITALRERLAAEAERAKEQIRLLDAEAKEHAAGRDAIASQIDTLLLRRYEDIRRKKSPAISEVLNGICKGCHMAVPPQLNNVLARFDSVENCPRCHRLLYRQELLQDSDEQSD